MSAAFLGCGRSFAGSTADGLEGSETLSEAFEPAPCFVATPPGHEAVCGFVRLDDGDPRSSRATRLATVILRKARPTSGTPLAYLAGGPGESAIALLSRRPVAFEEVLRDRDLILIDQRGTGFSTPSLQCLGSDGSAEYCRLRLQAQGVDLSRYSSSQTAADTDAVRQALGYRRWSLYGQSYGSRVALAIAKRYPDTVASVVLDGFGAPGVDLVAEATGAVASAFEHLHAACEAQPHCATSFGPVREHLAAIVASFDAHPEELSTELGVRVHVDGSAIMQRLAQLMSFYPALPVLPSLIQALSSRDLAKLTLLFTPPPEAPQVPLARGVYLSIMCRENPAATDRATIEKRRSLVDPIYRSAYDPNVILGACAQWRMPDLPPLVSDGRSVATPALILSGAFDPLTPPALADPARAGLANVTHIVLPDGTHGAGQMPCGMRLTAEFLRSGSVSTASPCVREPQVPRFHAFDSEIP